MATDLTVTWREAAFATDPADRAVAEAGVRRAYRDAGLAEPEHILWFGSPASGAVAAAALSGGPEARAMLASAGLGQVADQVLSRVGTAPAGRCVRDSVRTGPWERARRAVHAVLGPAGWAGAWASSGGELWPPVNRLVIEIRRAIAATAGGTAGSPGGRDATAGETAGATTAGETAGATTAGETAGDGAAGELLRGVTLDAVLGQHDAAWLCAFAPDAGVLREILTGVAEAERSALGSLFDVARSAGWWWPFERVALLCERPRELHLDDLGRLHRADGPAMLFPDGFALDAWHGMPVPAGFSETMATLDAARIRTESNAELRRVMLEHYGYDRYLADSGASPVHSDETGVLWRIALPEDEDVTMVEVVNSTPEPDGTRRTYFLRVPPWIERARQGVAWTFGVAEEDYQPERET
ncbi:DUF6745 domain-containing protein [Microtetraspora sp. NBRC 16547]|uniref:DUF6745 domain-containing protein n=1 Tax=Microtetraspora sp. NBRC 16547 TaxID=3030993 RepID=UPI0024A4A23B|nr:hypothetical protein [Microtetraspora sp. NBRC 16547]GLX01178.1 hypothetical protein Misp02_52640 [Microtetraspora sp. NBRC 16547]